MKNIYVSFAIFLGAFQLNAQSNLSADQAEGLSMTKHPVDLSAVKVQNNPAPLLLSLPCDTMKTTFAAGNSQNGNMFDVVNTNSIIAQITGIDQCFSFSSGTDSLLVYYKTGTFVGSEANAGAWTFAGKAAVSPTVVSTPIPVALPLNIAIPASGTVGLYITLQANSVAYTNGPTLGNVYRSKDGLNFKEGKGIQYPFGSFFPASGTASRVWNGILHYCVGGTAGVSEVENTDNITVYPNPASDNITVKNSGGNFNTVTVTLTDLSGRMAVKTTQSGGSDLMINTSGLESGIYLLNIKDENGLNVTRKIAVK